MAEPTSPAIGAGSQFAVPTGEQHLRDKFDARGWSGLSRWGGTINETVLSKLSGKQGIRVFNEMWQTDPTVGVGILTTQMLIRSVQWGVEPASDSAEDKALAEYVEECMHDMEHSWSDFIDEALSMLVFGWSLHEVVYKIRGGPNERNPKRKSKFSDGRLGWRSLRLRSQETLDRWAWEPESDELVGMWQVSEMLRGPQFIPLIKAVHFRTSKHKDNPEGRSLLLNAYRPWKFKKEIEVVEGIGIERDLVGVPIAKVPPEVLHTEAQGEERAMREYLENILGDLRVDERAYLLFPHDDAGYTFDVIQGSGQRQIDLDPVLGRKSREIAFAMLMDFIMLGHEQHGTQALAGTKVDVYKVAIHGWVEALEEALNNQLVPKLFELQGDKPDELPKIKGGKISTIDVNGKMEILEALARMGTFGFGGPPIEIVNEMLRDVDLPEVEETDLPDPDGDVAPQEGDDPEDLGEEHPEDDPEPTDEGEEGDNDGGDE